MNATWRKYDPDTSSITRLREESELSMGNLDHSIDEGLADALRNTNTYALVAVGLHRKPGFVLPGDICFGETEDRS